MKQHHLAAGKRSAHLITWRVIESHDWLKVMFVRPVRLGLVLAEWTQWRWRWSVNIWTSPQDMTECVSGSSQVRSSLLETSEWNDSKMCVCELHVRSCGVSLSLCFIILLWSNLNFKHFELMVLFFVFRENGVVIVVNTVGPHVPLSGSDPLRSDTTEEALRSSSLRTNTT